MVSACELILTWLWMTVDPWHWADIFLFPALKLDMCHPVVLSGASSLMSLVFDLVLRHSKH
jgi:hypothetical protein